MAARLVAALLMLNFVTPLAAESLGRKTVWDFQLGKPLDQQPGADEFQGYACGANGGPPRKAISSMRDFAQCAPEQGGLHEVYFEYDDELEYVARALQQPDNIKRFAGTAEAGFALMTSVLIDGRGIVRGARVLTDSRPDARKDSGSDLKPRDSAYQFGALMAARFDIEASHDCRASAPAEGESAVGGLFVKLDCEKKAAEQHRLYRLSVRLLRKAGQSGRDPRVPTQLTRGQFESLARLDILELP